jgi:23S rRNA maturation mini-RNase III
MHVNENVQDMTTNFLSALTIETYLTCNNVYGSVENRTLTIKKGNSYIRTENKESQQQVSKDHQQKKAYKLTALGLELEEEISKIDRAAATLTEFKSTIKVSYQALVVFVLTRNHTILDEIVDSSNPPCRRQDHDNLSII